MQHVAWRENFVVVVVCRLSLVIRRLGQGEEQGRGQGSPDEKKTKPSGSKKTSTKQSLPF